MTQQAEPEVTEEQAKLTAEVVCTRAIRALRKPPHKGIHSVYSGFNEAFRIYFNGADPVKCVNDLVTAGKLEIRPTRGGVMMYLPGEGNGNRATAAEILKQIVGT